MKKLLTTALAALTVAASAAQAPDWKPFSGVIRDNIGKDFKLMYREAGNGLAYPFLTAGSENYNDCLWDWDSWLCDIALRQVLTDKGNKADQKEALTYEQGCILNYLSYCGGEGWIPIILQRGVDPASLRPKDMFAENMHKPCLAQHAAFLINFTDGGDAEWLREDFAKLQYFMNGYRTRQFHRPTGLYFWITDIMIGVDNDPCTFYRPNKSSANIYLNTMMYKELEAMSFLAGKLGLDEIKADYDQWAADLKAAIREHCWDERDGFYYSVDINLLPRIDDKVAYHMGAQREWDCLIQRIDVWSGFMAMWAGIATPEQAERMVKEHYRNPKTFNCAAGVRTLSKLEKQYNVKASSNPSSWLGPVWGISNYMTWRGLVKYGFKQDAQELASKTIVMFGRDFQKTGALHEYYQPDNGDPILNKGFQNWNFLVLNMLDWMENKPVVAEF